MPARTGPATVLVHGLWMRGVEMSVLRARLRHCGLCAVRFSYPSRHADLAHNARRLNAFVTKLSVPQVHFVGHSLGGLVILKMFQDYPAQPPGRIVTLGTPHTGSHVARWLASHGLGRWMLGQSRVMGLVADPPPAPPGRDLGVIAGTLNVGFGWWVPGMPAPSDGTVTVAETRAPGLTAHLRVHTSHMALVLSQEVAHQTCVFLKTGQFETPAAES